jgi:hypothetical protein
VSLREKGRVLFFICKKKLKLRETLFVSLFVIYVKFEKGSAYNFVGNGLFLFRFFFLTIICLSEMGFGKSVCS